MNSTWCTSRSEFGLDKFDFLAKLNYLPSVGFDMNNKWDTMQWLNFNVDNLVSGSCISFQNLSIYLKSVLI